MKGNRRIQVLFLTIVFFGFIAWQLAIKETIRLSKEVSLKEAELQNLSNASEEIDILKSKLELLKGNTNKIESDIDQLRKQVFSQTTTLCEKFEIKLVSLPEYFESESQEISVFTTSIKLSGSYKKLLQLLDELEKQLKIGKISSSKFVLEKNLRSKRYSLNLYVYIQSIKLKS